MTMPEQQADELVVLTALKAWDPALSGATILQPPPPEPDGVFLFADGAEIAVELTESVREESTVGGVTKGHEAQQTKAGERAQSALGPLPDVHVYITWSPSPPRKWPVKVDAVAAALAKLVQTNTPAVPPRDVPIVDSEIEWDALDPLLQDLVHSIRIWRTPKPSGGSWSSPFGGIPYTDPAQVQDRVDDKAGKLNAYSKPGRPNWLVVHALGVTPTGLADFGALASMIFLGPFDRLLAFDPFLNFHELKIQLGQL